MPKAVQERTRTSAASPPTSRRIFIGATSTALLAGGAVAAMGFPGHEPAIPIIEPGADAALIAACAEYHVQHAEWHREHTTVEEYERASAAREEALELIATLTPVTEEGLRAKAGVAHHCTVWLLAWEVTKDWRENASPEELIATAVLAQMAGRA